MLQFCKRLNALLLYSILFVPFGIALHLGVEAIALGTSLDRQTFVARHLYLFLIESGAAALFWMSSGRCLLQAVRTELRQFVHILRAKGNSTHFFLLGVAVQWGFFAATLHLESTPLTKDEFVIGCCVALFGASLGSLMLAILPQQLLTVLTGLYFRYTAAAAGKRFLIADLGVKNAIGTAAGYRTVTGSRPPPSN